MTYLIIILLAILGTYLGIALFYQNQARTPRGFYEVPSPSHSVRSMVFGGVTLGTGFAYLTNIGLQLGLWAFAAPLGIVLGFLIIRKLEMRIIANNKHGLDANFQRYLEQKDSISWIVRYFNLLRIVVFIALISFEVYVSSQYIGNVFGYEASSDSVFLFAILISVSCVAYCAIGGLSAAMRTDFVQAGFVLALMAIFAGFAIYASQDLITSLKKAFDPFKIRLDSESIFMILSSFLAAVSTQFYNIINSISTVTRNSFENSRSYFITAFSLPLVTAMIIFLGVLFSSSEFGSMETFLYARPIDGFWNKVIAVVILLGFTSIIFTTLDALIISVSRMIGDQLGADIDSAEERLWPRVICLIIGVAIIPISISLLFLNTGYVETLFVLVTPIGGLGSYLTFLLACRIYKCRLLFDWLIDNLSFAYIIFVSALAIYDLVKNDGSNSSIFNVIVYFPSIIGALLIILRTRWGFKIMWRE